MDSKVVAALHDGFRAALMDPEFLKSVERQAQFRPLDPVTPVQITPVLATDIEDDGCVM